MRYILVLGVVYHPYSASARNASTRHGALHRHMDAGVSRLVPDALVRIPVHSDFVVIQSTHSAALFRSAPVLSSLLKCDPVSLGAPASRRLRCEPEEKRTFAREGLALAEWDGKVLLAEAATSRHVVELDGTMARIRTDLPRVIVFERRPQSPGAQSA
ncbi:hypothetical protein EXIGLDRAFT_776160 [Exidia glandulosa HHB12029]|uniref:Uncharacterized protein n=1 Tax=Exidia glandulosa HHB12029 TaxID=1314781 RepID=A0A165DKU3_EXIGL|nr:hypothetical protein EXIGLDRAFT_776160 [Exidia glandulosa HHB12029]